MGRNFKFRRNLLSSVVGLCFLSIVIGSPQTHAAPKSIVIQTPKFFLKANRPEADSGVPFAQTIWTPSGSMQFKKADSKSSSVDIETWTDFWRIKKTGSYRGHIRFLEISKREKNGYIKLVFEYLDSYRLRKVSFEPYRRLGLSTEPFCESELLRKNSSMFTNIVERLELESVKKYLRQSPKIDQSCKSLPPEDQEKFMGGVSALLTKNLTEENFLTCVETIDPLAEHKIRTVFLSWLAGAGSDSISCGPLPPPLTAQFDQATRKTTVPPPFLSSEVVTKKLRHEAIHGSYLGNNDKGDHELADCCLDGGKAGLCKERTERATRENEMAESVIGALPTVREYLKNQGAKVDSKIEMDGLKKVIGERFSTLASLTPDCAEKWFSENSCKGILKGELYKIEAEWLEIRCKTCKPAEVSDAGLSLVQSDIGNVFHEFTFSGVAQAPAKNEIAFLSPPATAPTLPDSSNLQTVRQIPFGQEASRVALFSSDPSTSPEVAKMAEESTGMIKSEVRFADSAFKRVFPVSTFPSDPGAPIGHSSQRNPNNNRPSYSDNRIASIAQAARAATPYPDYSDTQRAQTANIPSIPNGDQTLANDSISTRKIPEVVLGSSLNAGAGAEPYPRSKPSPQQGSKSNSVEKAQNKVEPLGSSISAIGNVDAGTTVSKSSARSPASLPNREVVTAKVGQQTRTKQEWQKIWQGLLEGQPWPIGLATNQEFLRFLAGQRVKIEVGSKVLGNAVDPLASCKVIRNNLSCVSSDSLEAD